MTIVPTDSPSVFAPLNTLVLDQAQYAIVRPDNPPPGIAGFLFSVVDDDTVELESEITDHFTEENNPVQDHIALRPESVTVTGDVAEVIRDVVSSKPVNPVANPLPLIPGLTPELAPVAQNKEAAALANQQNEAASIESTQSFFGYYQSKLPQQPNQTKQQVAFGYFYQLWKGRQLFSVETPWGFFTNMAIQSVSSHQGPVTRFVSDFTITFKKIRTVRSVTIIPGLLAGRAAYQRAPITQNGVIGQLTLTPAQEGQYVQSIANPAP